MRLEGRVALVFGAGAVGEQWGNGRACAAAYAREGGTCLADAADVSHSAEVEAAVQRAVAAWGRVDILHNNVGILKLGGPVDLSEQDWDRTLSVNLNGVFLTCKHVLPLMKARRSGVVTNISSTASLRFAPYQFIAYNASKAALNRVTEVVAGQYALDGIRCNALAPGLMHGPIIHTDSKLLEFYGSENEMIRQRHAAVPTGQMGEVWDTPAPQCFSPPTTRPMSTGRCCWWTGRSAPDPHSCDGPFGGTGGARVRCRRLRPGLEKRQRLRRRVRPGRPGKMR